ncbi:hypothetical protein F4680DRAFT_291653 [Xylaria scruposa]|nr:hypothetical protein F4680DRAFT_291653 [Xylaria scruposa]
MALVSLPLTDHENPPKEACPNRYGFYRCGNFTGCCPADPCSFLNFDSPCDAAIAALADQDGNNGDDGNGNGDDNGNGGGGDGGDKDTITITTMTTTRHTSTLAPTPSSTKSIETITSKTTPSFTILPFISSSGGAPTTIVNSFASATGISTSPVSSSVTETTPPAPSEESNNDKNNNSIAAPLSNTTIAGASVGGVVGGIALLLLVFWLLRRRRLSKRMSSLRGDSPGPNRPHAEKPIMDRHHSLTGTALGIQSFPEIRVQPPTPQQHTEQLLPTSTRRDEGWPLRTASDPSLHQQFSSQRQQQQHVYAELDSAETQFTGTVPPGTQSLNRRPSPQIHPSQLTPGFPGTQMAIQTRSGSGNVNVGADRGYHGYAPSVGNANGSGEALPRATLNATDDERLNNLYANSWARGL